MDLSFINIPIPIGTFLLGWLLSRFTLTKADAKKLEQDYYKNSQDLRQKHESLYSEYAESIRNYTSEAGRPLYQHFFQIAVKGDRYFGHMNIIADAIISGKVDKQTRDSTFAPGIGQAAIKSLPRHYEVLKEIADKEGFDYSGELERSNYESLFAVAEKYPLKR